MKRKMFSIGFFVAMMFAAFLVSPAKSLAYSESNYEDTDYVDKKNRFLHYGCKPKVDYVCETEEGEEIE